MAQRTILSLEDDLDGGVAEETVAFALDGTAYLIDLSGDHAEEFRESLAHWVGHARKVRGTAKRAARKRAPVAVVAPVEVTPASTEDIRAWAIANGYQVSARGRIASAVKEAYEAAH